MAYLETALYCDSVAYTAVAAWAATHGYVAGNIIRQLAAPAAGNERCFVCITAGTSLSSEPFWSIAKGAKTTETAGPVWMECTALPALNGDSANTNAWKASQGSIALGAVIKNIAADHYFICTTAGTGGTGVEPTWNTTAGAATTDGSVTWTCLGAISSFTARWAAAAKMLLNPVWNSSGWLVNANMTVYVGDDHAETASASYTPAFACQVLCVDHTVAFPLSTANLKTTAAITFPGGYAFWAAVIDGYIYGLQFLDPSGAGPTYFNLGGFAHVLAEQCLFSSTGNATVLQIGDNSRIGLVECKSCAFVGGGSFTTIRILGNLRLEACSTSGWAGTGNNAELFSPGSSAGNFAAEGSDLTGIAAGVALVGNAGSGAQGYVLFKDCKMPAAVPVFRGGDAGMSGLVIDLNRCDSGGTNYRNERHSSNGTLTASTGLARTGGASDGATPISHQVATTSNALFPYRTFNSLPLVIWNAITGSNRNVTINGIANDYRVPNNDELFIDVEYLGSSSSPQGSYARGGKTALGTAAALTADTSAWDSAVTARANTHAYSAGNAIKVASNPGRVFFCTGGGTSAGSEPSGSSIANTWNPSDASAFIVLTNGNLTAGASQANQGVRGKAPSAKKFYFEVTISATGSFFGSGVGIATAAAVLTTSYNPPTNAAYVDRQTGNIVMVTTSNVLGTLGAFTNSDVFCVAVDMTNLRAWFRKNGGNWNGNSAANPATNVGGIDISPVFTGASAYPLQVFANSESVTYTANFGATTFAQTVPSGFSNSQCEGYASAVDGDTVADGLAAFRAGCRFSQTLILGPGPTTYSTWDPATLALTTLSGGNLVATNTGTTQTEQGAHGTLALTSGKYYFEATRGATSAGVNQSIGIGTPASTYTGMGNVGGVTGDVVFIGAGNIYANGSSTGSSIGSIASGYVIGVAVDLDNRLVWFRVAPSGNWNGSGTANPATGVGGIAIPAGAMTPFCTFGGGSGVAGGSWTGNFGPSGFTGAVPAGFTSGWLTFSGGPQPAQAGYIYAYPRIGRPSMTYYIDPLINLS